VHEFRVLGKTGDEKEVHAVACRELAEVLVAGGAR
jgi:hypothetical protein